MADVPKLTEMQHRVLSIISEDGDVLLFGLEVQELTQLGLVADEDGVLKLTDVGSATLEAIRKLSDL